MQDQTFDPHKAIDSVVSQRTTAEKEEWDKYQEEQRAKLEMLDGNHLLGARQVDLALRELENGDSDFEYTRMAEGYALQGDFQKAYELTRDEVKRAEYEQVLDAFTNLDCPCPTIERIGKTSIPIRFEKLKFQDKTLVECSRCRNLTVC